MLFFCRPTTASGEGAFRPGTSRPATSRPVTTSGRCLCYFLYILLQWYMRYLNLVRFVRLGTASLMSEPGGEFVNVDKLNLSKYAQRPALAKVSHLLHLFYAQD